MSKVEEAKARVSKSPDDAAAWIALVQTMDAEVRSLDPQKVWEAAVDRWTALDRIAELAPSEEWMTTRAEHFGWMASVCARSGRPELAAELGMRELAALRALLPHSGDLEAVARQMIPRAHKLAEAAEAADAGPQAAAALEHMLMALYVLAESTGKPEYALQLAGVHVHASIYARDLDAQAAHLEQALGLIGRLEEAGLRHPLQEAIKRDARDKLDKKTIH